MGNVAQVACCGSWKGRRRRPDGDVDEDGTLGFGRWLAVKHNQNTARVETGPNN